MEITKEILQERIAGMTQQMGILLEQVSQVRGAIRVCEELIEHLAASGNPEEPPEGPCLGTLVPEDKEGV